MSKMAEDEEESDSRLKKNLQSMISGVVSGGCAALVTCPLDVMKTRIQVQKLTGVNNFRLIELGGNIWRVEGIRGFYRGLGAILVALMPNWACFFTSYNELKNLGERFFDSNSSMLHALSALGAATITNVATQPIWTIKTRLQTQILRGTEQQYRGTFHAFRTIVRNEGFFALYSGFLAQSVGGVHVIVQFPAYEKLKLYLKQRKEIKNINIRERERERPIISSSSISSSQINNDNNNNILINGNHDNNNHQYSSSTYENSEYYDEEYYEEEENSNREDSLTPLEIIFASALSKLLGSTLAYPTEVVRSRMQYQRTGDPNRYSGFTNAVFRIWKEEGIRGFYSGLVANMCRVIPACAITFLSYEIVLAALIDRYG